jgi:hypothetical protein
VIQCPLLAGKSRVLVPISVAQHDWRSNASESRLSTLNGPRPRTAFGESNNAHVGRKNPDMRFHLIFPSANIAKRYWAFVSAIHAVVSIVSKNEDRAGRYYSEWEIPFVPTSRFDRMKVPLGDRLSVSIQN